MLMLLGIFLLFTPIVNAQSQETSTTEITSTRKSTYRYSFESAASEESVKSAEMAIAKLLNVTEVKYQYKSDSKRGQFIITVVETYGKSESQEYFSPKMIKDAMLQNGLEPIDFTLTEEIVK